MQTILGAGGVIGTELAKALSQYTNDIRLVSRNPVEVNPGDELFRADLTNEEELAKAIEGSDIVYLTVGFEYNAQAWKQKWPPLMKRVIRLCKEQNAKFVFFSNVYMYDPDHMGCMTEETPLRPISKKGQVRAEIAEMLLNEIENKQITAMIVRSADFLATQNSVLIEMAYKNLVKGKKADWIADVHKTHSFTYAPDAAKATALLGNTPDAYGQVWHLPTSAKRLTGLNWIHLIAKEIGVKPRHRTLPTWLMGVLGLFIPVIKEFKEMAYQYDRDYFFDSSKFKERFGDMVTQPKDAVKQVIQQLKEMQRSK